MQINEIAPKMGWIRLTAENGENNEISGVYAGDLLSWVMGRAKEGNLWFTVIGNQNAIAVAVLTDVSAIILTEGASLDNEAKLRAEQQSIAVYSTTENTAEALIKAHEFLKNV